MDRMTIINKFNWKAVLILCLLCIYQVVAIPSPYNWRETAVKASSPKLAGASLAFDRKNNQLILFGGDGENGKHSNETWVWNDGNWKQLFPTDSPAGRRFASMAFDPISYQLILFGGEGEKVYNDTWTWNGSNWEQLTPTNTPPVRSHASIAFDPINAQLLLFAGAGGNINENRVNLKDTWTWNGSNWIQLSPETTPIARHGSGMSFAKNTNQLILFGGTTGPDFLNDTWTWNGSNWVQLFPETYPQGRCFISMAFDPISDQLLMFGGFGINIGIVDLNDTWAWNGESWIHHSTQSILKPRSAASLAYDEMHQQLILFGGGFGVANLRNDTWLWVPLPLVTNVMSSSQSTTGTTPIIITGANFDSVLSVQFGSHVITSFTVDSPTQITINSLPKIHSGSNEPVDITVTTASGTSLPSAASQFTYKEEKVEEPSRLTPVITWASANSGSVNGGTTITIAGENFIDVESVFFGSQEAVSFTINSANEMVIVSPAQSEGVVPIIIKTKHKTSPIYDAALFTYVKHDPADHSRDGKDHDSDSGKDKDKPSDIIVDIEAAVLPPLNFQGFQKVKVQNAKQDDVCKKGIKGAMFFSVINTLTWEANPEGNPAVSYSIYRDAKLRDLVDVVHSDQSLRLKDKVEHSKRASYTYYIVAEDEFGNISSPVSITLKTVK